MTAAAAAEKEQSSWEFSIHFNLMLKAERSYHKLISRRVEAAATNENGVKKEKKTQTHKQKSIARNIGVVNAANADNYIEIPMWAQAKTILI